MIELYLAFIDNLSNNGTSIIHDMNSIIKLLATSLLFIAVLLTDTLIGATILFIIFVFLFKLGQIPLATVGRLALYPAFFSLLFALIKIGQSWQEGLLIVVRSALAALSLLMLISTTPYNEIIYFFSMFMPPLLIDILIFTYRAFFILVDQIGNMLRNIKLRGGYHRKNLFLNIKNMASILGVLMLRTIEMSERMYLIYTLRGYDGEINVNRYEEGISLTDIVFIVFCLIILVGVIII